MKKLVMLTASDYPTAKIIDEVGIDYILVGDSLGMTVLGFKDTKSVTLDMILHHLKAVVAGAPHTKIIGDMPIHTYDIPHDALKNAKKLIKAGAYAVKIEGFKPDVIKILHENNIKVMGHLGLLPQTAETYKVQGRDEKDATQILTDAKKLDTLDLIALVLELVPSDLAAKITQSIKTPTIGIGAGADCSGQVLVLYDLIGLSGFKGKFVKQYVDLETQIRKAVSDYKSDVQKEKFPTKDHSF